MARSSSRLGRIRRVLNEDLSGTYSSVAPEVIPGDTPRYGVGANIENHPQVSDYVPRRMRVMAAILFAGLLLGVSAELLARRADYLASMVSQSVTSAAFVQLADRLVAWTSAGTLLVFAVYAHIIFLLKRHRVDDVKGRYRIWRIAMRLAIVLSANCVLGAHSLIADLLSHQTGWQGFAGGAGWWLVPAWFVGGYVLVNLVINLAECRLALMTMLVAGTLLVGASLAAVGALPASAEPWNDSLVRGLPLAAYLCCLSACLLTARYVVLDVQGLIEHAQRVAPDRPQHTKQSSQSVSPADTSSNDAQAAQQTEWVDGSSTVDDFPKDRPLSKAERKRLRKNHRRHAA